MDWRPICRPPTEDQPVLLYYAGWDWHDLEGALADLGPHRGVCDRTQAGWFEAGRFYVSGTGHEAFEPDGESLWPTHWAPLCAPAKEPKR